MMIIPISQLFKVDILLVNTNRIGEHAHHMWHDRQRRTTLENNGIDNRMNRVPEITKQDKTRNIFCKEYESVCKHCTYYTAEIIHDPQSTAVIALQSQQITKRGNINRFYRISVADNLKRISARSFTRKTKTIIHISSLYDNSDDIL